MTKLTKKALNEFITWSTTRYNDYLGYGSKKDNVKIVFNSLTNGFYTDERGRKDESKKVFIIKCAQSVGENGSGRYWKNNSAGEDYTVDCINKTISAKFSKREIKFL
jgi:hypothetical protein